MAHQRGFIYAMSLVTQEPIKIHQICIWQMEVSEKKGFHEPFNVIIKLRFFFTLLSV